jgi:hypothetical protein
MECKPIKGNAIQFGTYGFEHINLPPERPDYWDIKVKVAKIAESTSLTQGRFDVTLEKDSPCAPFKYKLPRMKNIINYKPQRCYELEELRSYECWSLLTPKLLDSITHKLNIHSVVSL